MYIIVRYSFKALKPSAQYYSKPEGYPKHYWSFNDRNAQIFDTLEEAQNAQSWAYENDSLMNVVMQWSEEMRQPNDVEIWGFSTLQNKARELGLEVIY